MKAEEIDISIMTRGQRVALMERLWQSLAEDLEKQGPPAWHDAVLDSREKEWADRHNVARDWADVREELKRDVQ